MNSAHQHVTYIIDKHTTFIEGPNAKAMVMMRQSYGDVKGFKTVYFSDCTPTHGTLTLRTPQGMRTLALSDQQIAEVVSVVPLELLYKPVKDQVEEKLPVYAQPDHEDFRKNGRARARR